MSPEPDPDVVARGHALPSPFACSYTNGGLDAACVRLGGELDLRELAFIDSCGMHASSVPEQPRSAGRPPAGSRARALRFTFPSMGQSKQSVKCRDNRHDPVDRGARKGSTS